MKLIIESWKRFLQEQEEEQEENLTEEEIFLYLQHSSIGLYKGQETNRLFWAPSRMTRFDSRSHVDSAKKAFQMAGINVSMEQIAKIKEKIINKVNKGEKIGNYNITKQGVQNKHYGDAFLSFMKKYGKPNSTVLYSGGTIEIKGSPSSDKFENGLWAYVSNLIKLGFPKEKTLQLYSKDQKSLIPPEGGRKLPSLKDFKMAVGKKLLKNYSYDSKIQKIAKDGGMGDRLDPAVDIDPDEYGLDTGFGRYKTLKGQYELIVKDIKAFEKGYSSIQNAIKNINPAQIPARRRLAHSFSSDINETTRFMTRRDREDSSGESPDHHRCLMVVAPGAASKTMEIEADDASTTEKETIIIGKYKTTKLEIHEDGYIIQYVKFNK